MGKNNKARRAAKAKARKARSTGYEPDGRSHGDGYDEPGWQGPEEPFMSETERVADLLNLTAQARHNGEPMASTGLGALESIAASIVDAQAESMLRRAVARLWDSGWQPAELHRQGRLGCPTAAGGRLVGHAVAADHAGRRADTLDPRWITQVDTLRLPAADGRPGWLSRWGRAEGFDRPQVIETIVDALANLMWLPRIDPLIPPPGAQGSASGSASWTTTARADADPVLQRIRGLLAKAESTEFEAEATVFTAKAQELMTRHAIDVAMLRGQSAADQPVAIRVPVDAPYVDVKSLLLQTVAEAGRCRAVMHGGLTMSTVLGFPSDLAAVEMLFTSLLIQAQTALTEAASHAPAGTRVRSQSYRSSFLLAYTNRIGDRLDAINTEVYSQVEAEQGSDFLPVLASRAEEVDGFVSEQFGKLGFSGVRRGYDPAGWSSGRAAADKAELNAGELASR